MRIEKREKEHKTVMKFLIISLIICSPFIIMGSLILWAQHNVNNQYVAPTPIPVHEDGAIIHADEYYNFTSHTVEKKPNANSESLSASPSPSPSASPSPSPSRMNPTALGSITPTPIPSNGYIPVIGDSSKPTESLTQIHGTDVYSAKLTSSPSIQVGLLVPDTYSPYWYMSSDNAYIGDTMVIGIAIKNLNTFVIDKPKVVIQVFGEDGAMEIQKNMDSNFDFPAQTEYVKYYQLPIAGVNRGFHRIVLSILDKNGNFGCSITKEINIF